jgi:hypothetical protein
MKLVIDVFEKADEEEGTYDGTVQTGSTGLRIQSANTAITAF